MRPTSSLPIAFPKVNYNVVIRRIQRRGDWLVIYSKYVKVEALRWWEGRSEVKSSGLGEGRRKGE